jgi:HK97 gp10 family phage protein
MAKVELKLPTDFEERLSRLADKTDEIIPKVLEAGGEVVLAKVKGNLSSVVGVGTKEESRSTGELERSLGLSPAKQKQDGSGWDVKVGFSEPRSDGTSNAKIANILEYGRYGQPPRPFLKPAKSSSKNAAIAAMKAKFESEVDGV